MGNPDIIKLPSSIQITTVILVYFCASIGGHDYQFIISPASRSDATRVTMHEMHGNRKSSCNRTTK